VAIADSAGCTNINTYDTHNGLDELLGSSDVITWMQLMQSIAANALSLHTADAVKVHGCLSLMHYMVSGRCGVS